MYDVRKDLNQGIIPIGVPRAYNFDYGIIQTARALLAASEADIKNNVALTKNNVALTNADVATVANYLQQIEALGVDDFFDIDVDGGLEPSLNPTFSVKWQLDSNGNIMPA
jgi:hypothetical protein